MNWKTMGESVLAVERVRLTALEEKDLATVATWYRDDHFSAHWPLKPPYPKRRTN